MKVSAIHTFQNLPQYPVAPIDNYDFVSLIGKGSFAKVVLARSKIDGKTYAIKIIKKARVVKSGFSEHLLTEKAILSYIDHPFMIKLK
jgi:serine/threonine protein kinase